MALCHCTAALFGKVVTLTFLEIVTVLHLKKFAIAKKKKKKRKKKKNIKQNNMKQKTFGFYFFQKK